LDLINKGGDVDASGAGFLAGTVHTFHATFGFSDGLFLGVESVMEVPFPVGMQ
jgi:hypothetical protein